MDPLGANKWLAAVLASVLLIMLINTYTDSIFGASEGTGDTKVAYGIEIAEATVVETAEVVVPSIGELLATANVAKGARQYAKCKACHTIDKGGKDGTGPHLYNIVGRTIGGVEGFKYSSALTGQTGTWDFETLDTWLASPKKAFPGTSMSFAGMKKPAARADLIEYMRNMADSPVPLPANAVEDLVEEVVDDVTN